jgi:PKD repeat protein
MKRLVGSLGLALAAVAVVLIACTQTPPVTPSLTVAPPSASLTAGGSGQVFTATLQNGSDTVFWSLSGSGTLSAASGPTTTYTPPASVAASETVTLTATAGTLTASATITVNPPSQSLTVAPPSATLSAGGSGQAFTATLVGSSETITWSLSGSGTLSVASGPTTTYTPPASAVATETVTLTATAGSLTASATITVNPAAPPATITVSGWVLKFNGDPASGVNVQIDDAAGLTLTAMTPEIEPLAATDPSGNFTIAGVTPPYTLSVIPPILQEVPQTWTGVTRSDPKVVINPFTGAATFCTTPAPGTINVTLTNPVGAGNTGQVVFIGEGIDHLEIFSNIFSAVMPAGSSTVPITVTFDPSLCQTVISGKLIYIERNVSGAIVNTGTANVTVPTGNVVAAQITVLTGTTRSVAGNVNFPVGTTSGTVYLVLKVGGASALIEAQAVTIADPDYDIAAPEMPGVQYRSFVLAGSFVGAQIQWAYSDVLTLPALNVNLQLPSLGETITPAGSIGSDVTPDFRFVQITGTNLNYVYFQDDPFIGASEWLGATQSTSIELPVLPAPARLTAGTMVAPNYYLWAPLNSIMVRAGGDADTMLDGRQVRKLYFGLAAFSNPDVISAGSYNILATSFNLP